MTPKQAEQFNKMRATLNRIGKDYMTPKQIERDTGAGLEYTEYLEMAYENIQSEAKAAVKGVREAIAK